jgi:GTPase SAR1 family protein
MPQEVKYFEKLNIGVTTIDKVKLDLQDDIVSTIKTWDAGRDVKKQCYHIIGPAGVGKTEICYQLQHELTDLTGYNFDLIKITSPVLTRDDFLIPFPIVGEETEQFKMLYSDFIPQQSSEYGLYVIDEFARGDHPLQQLLWQVQNEYAVHRYEFPKGWFVVSVDNPDESEYSMNTLEDAAGLRRQSHIYVEVSAPAFLKYGTKMDFHPFVLDYINTYHDRVYDFASQKVGSVYANPASWEKVSDIIWKAEISTEGNFDIQKLETRIAGLLNSSAAMLFIGFCLDNTNIVKPSDIISDYKNKAQPIIQKMLNSNDNAKLGELMTSFNTYLQNTMPDLSGSEIQNIHDFLIAMPVDTASLLIIQSDIDRTSKEFRYITKLMKELYKSKVFQQRFFEKLRNPKG